MPMRYCSAAISEVLGVIPCVGVVLCVCLAAGCGWVWSLPPLPDSGRADSSSADTSPADGALSDAQADAMVDRGGADGPRKLDVTQGDLARLDAASCPDGASCFNFTSGIPPGWSVDGRWDVVDGQLEAQEASHANTTSVPFIVSWTQGTLKMDVRVPTSGCHYGILQLARSKTADVVLKFGLEACVNSKYWLECVGMSSTRPNWSADAAWHTVEVSFANGTYHLYVDSVEVANTTGPTRLEASYLQLESYGSGTRFDNISLSGS